MRWVIAWLGLCGAALAEGEQAGDFDYYVLSLSWQPTWCALEGAARGAEECTWGQGFVLHGLWPQYERGWPSYCATMERDPPRRQTEAMADVMAPGLAWHQWKKHGRCSGLPAADYFALMREAAERVALPEVFYRLRQDLALPASVVEDAFREANPGLRRDAITVTCEAGRIQEARICLTRDLDFRDCGADAVRDCRLTDAVMDGVR